MISTDKIHSLPEYAALTRARNKIVWPLSAAVILVYFAFILTIAFEPQALATTLGTGVTSMGVVLGLGVIIFCLVITGVYVYYANHVLEPLARRIHQKLEEAQ